MRKLAVQILVVGLLAGCGGGDQAGELEFRVPVAVEEVTLGAVEDRIVTTGTLRAAEGVTLTVETGGVLSIARGAAGRRLGEGDQVRAGQRIAEITGEDVRVAARTDASRARHETALQDYEATKSLYDQGLISESELHRAESALAEARLELDRSLLSEARSRLVTPIDGLILRLARDGQGLPMADGQLVAPGFVVAQIAPIERLVADVDVVGTDVARVQPGMLARVRQHAWEDQRFQGEVIRLAPALDPTTRAMKAEVEVENLDGLLRPGMYVEVTLVAQERTQVPVVPRRAVTERGGKRVVFVLKGQRVERREVTLGLGDDDTVEIREGVKEGERVVVRGLETLTDQTRVRVTSTQ